MKTLTEVKKQIEANIKFAAKNTLSEREYKRLQKETDEWQKIKMYLEFNPSEESLVATKELLERISKSLEDQYNVWLRHAKPPEIEQKNAKSFFNKEIGLTAIKRQLKTLDLILN